MNQLTEEIFEQTLRSFITPETIDLRDISFPGGQINIMLPEV